MAGNCGLHYTKTTDCRIIRHSWYIAPKGQRTIAEQLSNDYRTTLERLSDDSQTTFGRLSSDCRTTFKRLWDESRITIGRLSSDYRTTLKQLSDNSRATVKWPLNDSLFWNKNSIPGYRGSFFYNNFNNWQCKRAPWRFTKGRYDEVWKQKIAGC